jgi:hypothetical protein
MKRKYEGSAADRREDAAGAKRLGISQRQYEKTAQDRKEDAAGQRRLDQAIGNNVAAARRAMAQERMRVLTRRAR